MTTGSVRPSATRHSSISKSELYVTVFGTGAVVMLIEILGTRIIGPIFGVSLFVWAALLSATLSALAVGYYCGGIAVDRAPRPRLLGFVVLAAGVLLSIVPVLSAPALRALVTFGPRSGPLVCAFVLFAPSLLALGMTGPIAVRLATTDLRGAGQGVGSVYAISTAGSLVGTLVTAFWLIPTFETDQILVGGAILLIVLGATVLARRGRTLAFGAVAVPIFSGLAPQPTLPPAIKIVDRARSQYGLVEVIEDSERGVRLMRADHSVIGAQFIDNQTAAFGFLHLLEAVRFLRPAARDLLVIGLGSGSLPRVLASSGIKADVVEIDPAVVRFAKQHFGFATQGEVYIEDARTFLRRTDRHYDLIVHDTFTGGATPEHLLSLEVLQRIHELLRPGGVLALNFVGYQHGANAEGSLQVARTVRAAFRTVRSFRDRALDTNPDAATNLTFFASDAALDIAVPLDAKFENRTCERILRSFESWEVLKEIPDGPLITDERNPLTRLQLAAGEEHFQDMSKLLPLEVWLR
jgi:spermidine synthase